MPGPTKRAIVMTDTATPRGAMTTQTALALAPDTATHARGLVLSHRDLTIVARARRKLTTPAASFDDAMRALREAVAETIPAGRVFLLGRGVDSPVVGSIVSGVGIAEGCHGVELVHMSRSGARTFLESFSR